MLDAYILRINTLKDLKKFLKKLDNITKENDVNYYKIREEYENIITIRSELNHSYIAKAPRFSFYGKFFEKKSLINRVDLINKILAKQDSCLRLFPLELYGSNNSLMLINIETIELACFSSIECTSIRVLVRFKMTNERRSSGDVINPYIADDFSSRDVITDIDRVIEFFNKKIDLLKSYILVLHGEELFKIPEEFKLKVNSLLYNKLSDEEKLVIELEETEQ